MESERLQGHSIGAVTQLTGIAVETLRTWERRHQLVDPLRDESGRRVYSEAQVRRLQAVAALAQRGERVADLARLDDAELERRVRLHGAPRAGVVRVAVLSSSLGAGLAGRVDELGVEVEVVAAAAAPADLDIRAGIDLLWVDIETLGAAPEEALDALRARWRPPAIAVAHTFLARKVRARLERGGIKLVALPMSLAALRRRVATDLIPRPSTPRAEAVPLPRIEAPALARERLEALLDADSGLACECPNHLASLVLQLRAFEVYSRGCASRSSADAALHARLAEGTARAASWMEGLLRQVLEHEGLEG
jgi:DNA-binding transcriptional MerR regulator